MQGTVKWFKNDKGYGYVASAAGDVFVHYSAIKGDGYRRLDKGDRVEFELFKSAKGLQARNVCRLNKPNPATAGPGMTDGKEQGTVRWFKIDKGYGFIARQHGEDLFVHISAVQGSVLLKGGDRVEFDVTQGERGPEAHNVNRH